MFPDDVLPGPLVALLWVEHGPRPPIVGLALLVLCEGVVAGLHEGGGHVAQHGRGAVVDGRDLLPLVVVAPLDDDVRDEHLLGLSEGI